MKKSSISHIIKVNTLYSIQGAFFGLLFGFFVGMVRFVLEFGFREPPCGSGEEDARPEWIKMAVGNVNFLHFSPISFVITGAAVYLVSQVTRPVREEQVNDNMQSISS